MTATGRLGLTNACVLGGLAILLLLALLPAVDALADTPAPAHLPKDSWKLKMLRVEFDNDTFIGSDDSFSAGWSVQIHSPLRDKWGRKYASWIGKVPGLGDDGHGRRITRWAYSISQAIITPERITVAEPQPEDAPWAGILGISGNWAAYDNRRLADVQAFLGCMGPCSRAKEVQTFIHADLGFAARPTGWRNQLSNQALANLYYEYRYKVFEDKAAHYRPGRFALDFGVGGQAAAGNLNTSLSAQAEFRFGWGLPMGFTKIPDPAGLGTTVEPVYFEPEQPAPDLRHWRLYFNLVARRTWFAYFAPSESRSMENGYRHPATRPYPMEESAIFGLHLVRVPVGIHVTYYRYFDSPERAASADWVNLSLEYRF